MFRYMQGEFSSLATVVLDLDCDVLHWTLASTHVSDILGTFSTVAPALQCSESPSELPQGDKEQLLKLTTLSVSALTWV